MGDRIPITFLDGPKNGVTSHYISPRGTLPRELVFQGIIDGRFQILNYEHIPDTQTYRYRDSGTRV
jgi:hypothetical protein